MYNYMLSIVALSFMFDAAVCCEQTSLSLNNNLLLRLPEYFKDPEKFIPERWTRDGSMDSVHPYLLLPFGFGARTCAGQLKRDTSMKRECIYGDKTAEVRITQFSLNSA